MYILEEKNKKKLKKHVINESKIKKGANEINLYNQI